MMKQCRVLLIRLLVWSIVASTAQAEPSDWFPVDQSCESTSACLPVGDLGQEFIPDFSRHVGVEIFLASKPSFPHLIRVEIREGDINGPLVPGSDADQHPDQIGWVYLEFDETIFLEPGSLYVLRVTATTENEYSWCGSPAGVDCYNNGGRYVSGAYEDADFGFRLHYVIPQMVLDQTCDHVWSCYQIDAFEPIGQQFVPADTEHAGVALYIDDPNIGAPLDPVTMTLREGSIQGQPVDGGTVVITPDNPGWTHFMFDETLFLDPGTTYVISLETDTVRWSWCRSNTPACYSSGASYIDGALSGEGDQDFKTWVLTGTCPLDLDFDGVVGPADLSILLGAWGPQRGHPADFNGDGLVNPNDLGALLGFWGVCAEPG